MSQRKVAIAAAAAESGCKYRCPSCGQRFTTWSRCREHVIRREHAGATSGPAGLQQRCQPYNQSKPTGGYGSEPDTPLSTDAVGPAAPANAAPRAPSIGPPNGSGIDDGAVAEDWWIDVTPDGEQGAFVVRPEDGLEGQRHGRRHQKERAAKRRRSSRARECGEGGDALALAGGELADEALAQPWWQGVQRPGDDDDDDELAIAASGGMEEEEELGASRPATGPPPPLDESNKGYALLQTLGWSPGDGLGATNSGALLPAAATMSMQKSRRGLGR
jgi:hypothetical protein